MWASVVVGASPDVARARRRERCDRACRASAQAARRRTAHLRWVAPLILLCLAACWVNPTDPETALEFAKARSQLLADLGEQGINDARVLSALAAVPREEFVRREDRPYAYRNQALPIGRGQTISQPYVVALMTQLLQLQGDERVLEIGTGCGYQAAVLAKVAREVYSIEIDPLLATEAGQRLARLGYRQVHVRAGDGWFGWEEAAPFDAIIVTAAAPKIPERLVAQLRPGGRLVIPLGDEQRQILIRARKQDDQLKIENFTDVSFVPMTGVVRTPTP